MMILKISILFVSLLFAISNCTEDKKSNSNDLVLGLLAGSSQESSKDFVLNGSWNSFTGSSTTSTTISTYSAKSGTGVILLDGTSGSSYFLIADYSNSNGTYIAQNPPNGGAFAAFNGTIFTDTNKGKYFKIVFFKDSSASNTYWLCTVSTTASNTVAEANAIVDTSNRTNPGTTGCGGSFPWSRIVKR
jgi:hypothetical protein